MAHLLIRHKVAEFGRWKTTYDSHAPVRQAAGLKEEHLFRSADDPNEVVILFSAADLKKAKEFSSSPNLRETMQKAGVLDKPDIYYLN